MLEAQELPKRGRPRVLATLARILAEPALSATLPTEPSTEPTDRPPLHVELIHHVPRPIRTLDELNRKQHHLDRTAKKLLRH
jgi:hypothetical protein